MEKKVIQLPSPILKGNVSVEEALFKRCSTRSFKKVPLNLGEVSQLLWAAYGKNAYGKKTVPSAGATYPFDIYLVAGLVEDIEPGLYLYECERHTLIPVKQGDLREKLAVAAYDQKFIANAPITIVLVAQFARTTAYYGKRGERYVFLDAGHVGQNVSLQVEGMGLGTCMIGAFDDD
ncbi:MAG TPA: SagB/ThcOx family dehydrogenase [bacterium]|nr:SagB/ThcOx family dehydrogenase [bacterium]HOL35217.1 SagB/ThcOx family dehydrogenase [bacterium]HPP08703.1 SagB/ThcOx family dehydrogenase [bacterium]